LEKNSCLWLSLLCIVRKQIIFSDRATQHSTISLFQLLAVPPSGKCMPLTDRSKAKMVERPTGWTHEVTLKIILRLLYIVLETKQEVGYKSLVTCYQKLKKIRQLWIGYWWYQKMCWLFINFSL